MISWNSFVLDISFFDVVFWWCHFLLIRFAPDISESWQPFLLTALKPETMFLWCHGLHKVLPCTTLYYTACTRCFPVLLRTTMLAQALSSATSHYKTCTQYFPVLLGTTALKALPPVPEHGGSGSCLLTLNSFNVYGIFMGLLNLMLVFTTSCFGVSIFWRWFSHGLQLGVTNSMRVCFLDNSSLLVAEADNDEWEYHGNTQPWPGIWTILAVLTLQAWLWGATVLTTTIAILLTILLRLQPRRKKRLAYVALRICKRRYAHKATQEVLDLKAYAHHLALCKTWMPTRFHGGAGGSRTTMRKRQQEQRNTNDIEDADTLAAALIALATAFQQRRRHQQPPHTRQTTSMQPDRQQPRPPRNNQKTTVAPKLDLYASIHRIFQDKTQDPLPALMTLLTQAQEIRQARHNKRSMKTTAEQPTTPATTTNDTTRSLPILKNQTSSPTTTGEQLPRLTFDTKTPVMSGQRLIQLLEDSARLPQFLKLGIGKTKQFCETSSFFEVGNIKNEAILRDFLQKLKVECRAGGLVPMRFAIFPLHLS